MSTKPPLLMLLKQPAFSCLDHIGELYDLRHEPGPGITAALSGGNGIDAATMDAAPDLKMVALAVVGYDRVDLDHARAKGIAVTNTPDVLTDDVADLAIGLWLSLSRRLMTGDRYVREGRWPRHEALPLSTRASGRRIGVLGLGQIGRAIAARAAPFASEIAYHNRRPADGSPYAYAPSARALAEQCDVLFVATAGGADSRALVDAAVLEALGPQGLLVNVARGSVVDEAALVAALEAGTIAGAGLDVFLDEPNVPAALLNRDDVVLQPHRGSATVEARAAMARLVLENLARHFGA